MLKCQTKADHTLKAIKNDIAQCSQDIVLDTLKLKLT